MAARSRKAKDRDLAASLGKYHVSRGRFAGSKPALAMRPPAAPPAAPGPQERVESSFFGGPAGGGMGDQNLLQQYGPGGMLWRAIARGGIYDALGWAGKHPGVLTGGNKELTDYASKKGWL